MEAGAATTVAKWMYLMQAYYSSSHGSASMYSKQDAAQRHFGVHVVLSSHLH